MIPLARSAALPFVAALLLASGARAQVPGQPASAGAPRGGPRLEYRQGPHECLSEKEFRHEVAIAVQDGIDHFDDGAPDVVRVSFEKIPQGYRGTIEYTDASGAKDVPEVQTSANCEILARWVASSVSETIPRALAPSCPASPAPSCPACPAPSCSSCPGCGTSQSRPPLPAPSPIPALSSNPRWRMDLSVGVSTYVMMTAFLSADVGPAVAVGGEVRGEVFGVGAELRFVVPSRAYARDPIPGATSSYPQEFDIGLLAASFVPCARYSYFVGCGVAQLGALTYKTDNYFEVTATFGVGPRLGFEVPFAERFAVFGFGEVLFAPAQALLRFSLPDPKYPNEPPANSQWQQPIASAFFGAGVSVKFK